MKLYFEIHAKTNRDLEGLSCECVSKNVSVTERWAGVRSSAGR